MAQKEIVVETDICDEAEEAGYVVRKVTYAGRRGAPDRWFKRFDTPWILIEFKKKGEKPDGLQQREHDKLRGAGQKVYVIDNHDDARRVLKLGPYA